MPRHDENNQSDMQTQYNVPTQRILNDSDVSGADSIIVLAVKGGKATLWATDRPDKAQDLAAQYFGTGVQLPQSAGFMAGAGSDR